MEQIATQARENDGTSAPKTFFFKLHISITIKYCNIAVIILCEYPSGRGVQCYTIYAMHDDHIFNAVIFRK